MPDLNDFPNELLVEVFSYFDLKTLTRCMRVSKLFKAITEHSTFDMISFRTKAVESGDHIDFDKLQINPIFNRLHYTCRSKIKEVWFLFCDKKSDGQTDIRKLALIDSSAAKQNATEPAVTHLWLTPYDYEGVQVRSERALTVQDVMQGLCDYYQPGAGYDRCHYFFEGFQKREVLDSEELVLRARWGS